MCHFKNVLISEKKRSPLFEKNIPFVTFLSFFGLTNSALWFAKVFKSFFILDCPSTNPKYKDFWWGFHGYRTKLHAIHRVKGRAMGCSCAENERDENRLQLLRRQGCSALSHMATSGHRWLVNLSVSIFSQWLN